MCVGYQVKYETQYTNMSAGAAKPNAQGYAFAHPIFRPPLKKMMVFDICSCRRLCVAV